MDQIKNLMFQTYKPDGLEFDFYKNSYKGQQYAERFSTRLMVFFGFPTRQYTDRSFSANFFSNMLGLSYTRVSKWRRAWNLLKAPFMLAWHLATLPIKSAINCAKLFAIVLPSLIGMMMSNVSAYLYNKKYWNRGNKALYYFLTGLYRASSLIEGLTHLVSFVGRGLFAPSLGVYKANEIAEKITRKSNSFLSGVLIGLSLLVSAAGITAVSVLVMMNPWIQSLSIYLPPALKHNKALVTVYKYLTMGWTHLLNKMRMLSIAPQVLASFVGGNAVSVLVLGSLNEIQDAMYQTANAIVSAMRFVKNKLQQAFTKKNQQQNEVIEGKAANPKKAEAKPHRAPAKPQQGAAYQLKPVAAMPIKNGDEREKTKEIEKGIHNQSLIIENELGRGGFGVVYKATYKGMTVAVKQLLKEGRDDELNREIEILGMVKSPYVVTFHGRCVDKPWIIMEFMDKGNLHQVLEKEKINIGGPIYLEFANYIVNGIAYLHASRIIHMDLKSLNILVNQNNEAKMTDFGLSKYKPGNQTVIGPVHEGGTLLWMAPELLKPNARKANEKTDMYSIGCVLWELAGRGGYPYDKTENAIQTATPPSMKDLILRCWKERQKDRPTGAEAVAVVKALVGSRVSS